MTNVQTSPPPSTAPLPQPSNRVTLGLSNRLLARPEVGALVAAILIFIFFLVSAPAFRSGESFFTILYQSSTIGIVAVAVGMLMIGGEFDLSAGVITITAGLVNSMLCWNYGMNLWVGAVVSLLFCLFIGFVNGYLVMKTGIPSFLITLGTFFVLQGANLGVTKLVTGSVSSRDISAIDGFGSLQKVFASSFAAGPATVWITVLLFSLLAVLTAACVIPQRLAAPVPVEAATADQD
jgi:simple sugar transport system permease protein